MSKNITYKYWLATGTLVFFLLLSSISFSFYIILDNNERVFDKQISSINSFFLKDIRNDILQFNNFEVYSKCKNFGADSLVNRIKIINFSTNEVLCDLENPNQAHSGVGIDSYIFFDPEQKNKAAEIRVSYARKSTVELMRENISFILIIFLMLVVVTYFVLRKVSSLLFSDLVILSSHLDRASLGDLVSIEMKFKNKLSTEIFALVSKIKTLAQRLIDSQKSLVKQSELLAKSEVAAQVAHDIRSPLMSMRIASDKLSGDAKIKDLLVKSLNRIESIAEDLLKNYRSDLPSVDAKESSNNNKKLISNILNDILLEKQNSYPDINFNLNKSPSAIDLEFPIELERILSNIIQNSIEAFDPQVENKTVTLELKTANDKTEIVVEDNGKGIPEDVLPKLFKRGATFGKSNGNGLGLSYAKEYLESRGGAISLTSEIGKGTRVALCL